MNEDRFINELIEKFPNLKGMYDEHIDCHQKLLSEEFFIDLARWLVSVYSAEIKKENPEALIRRILEYLEEAFVKKGQGYVDYLIGVIFLQNLPGPYEEHCELAKLLGPAMAEEYRGTLELNGFLKKLIEKFPDLKGLYDEHIDYCHGLLSHSFLADITRWLVSVYSGEIKIENPEALIKRFLEYLEEAYVNESEEVNNLIAVAFIENLPGPYEEHCELARLLGPAMAEQYIVIYGYIK